MAATARSQLRPPSAASELLTWWRSELADRLGGLKRSRKAQPPRSVADIIVTRQGLLLGPTRAGPFATKDLASGLNEVFGRRGLSRSVAVTLEEGRFLKRKLADYRIPLERASVMAELDVETQTPFKRQDVYTLFAESWANERDTHFYVVRRDILDPVLDALDGSRRRLGQLTFGESDRAQQAAGFVISGLSGRSSFLDGMSRHALGLTCLVLISVAGYNVTAMLAAALSSVDSKIAHLEPQAKIARGAFKERAARLKAIEAVRAEQTSYVPAVRLIEELTSILPDTTYLTSVSIRPNRVKVTGFSSDAAGLISLVDASKFFENPRFVSAVVKVPDRSGEQFDLEAEVENVR